MSFASGEITVLHVDDDPELAAVVSEWLERKSKAVTVQSADSVEEGLDVLSREPIDCVVSDYEMPDRDGIDFLETVREDEPELPFILFTGKGSEEIASRAISAGVTDYLQKEVGTDQYAILANRIENAVGQYVAERAVERSQDRLRVVVDSLPHSVFVVDEDYRYLMSNEVHAQFHGLSVAVIEGAHAGDVLADEEFRQFRADVDRVLETEESRFVTDALVTPPSGEARIYEARMVPFDLVGTDRQTTLCVARDVTERRRRQRQLERQNEWLEEFVEVISHDLQSPLQVATNRLDLATDEGDSDQLDHVETALDRMGQLIEDLTTLAREGASVTELETVALADVAEQSWQTVETGDAGLEIGTGRSITADPGRLQQLFENLFINSVKHGRPAGQDGGDGPAEAASEPLTVTVGDLPGGFYVEDDGTGIPPEERDRVLESGYSASDGGSGLGLAIVSQIVAAHGWDLTVTEGTEGGARFEVRQVEAA